MLICAVLSCEIALADEADSFAYDNKGKRDPFVPLLKGTTGGYADLENIEAVSELVLEGVVWDPEGGSLAVINGTILKEGESLGSVRLLKIDRQKAFLEIDGIKHEIYVREKREGGGR